MLNLEKIFEKQQELNTKTALTNPKYGELTNDELTRNFVFAALVELGETSNEWGEFKIWKKSRKQNRLAVCKRCNNVDVDACIHCIDGTNNPLLEEYIDVFHFVVSVAIGLKLDVEFYVTFTNTDQLDYLKTTKDYDMFLRLYELLADTNSLLEPCINGELSGFQLLKNKTDREITSIKLMDVLLLLGYSLGFSDEEINEAYFSKHKVNHKRQEANY